jgi:hypothetical protein
MVLDDQAAHGLPVMVAVMAGKGQMLFSGGFSKISRWPLSGNAELWHNLLP